MGKTNQKQRGEKRAEEKANRLIKNIALHWLYWHYVLLLLLLYLYNNAAGNRT